MDDMVWWHGMESYTTAGSTDLVFPLGSYTNRVTNRWYGMVWYGIVWYGMAWYGMVWHGMVWCGMVHARMLVLVLYRFVSLMGWI